MDSQSQEKLQQLIRKQQIASLGTLGEGQPMVSMVLYGAATDFSRYYIHISQLASHTRNIMAHAQVSLMICETTRTNVNPQTLARLSVMGKASLLSPMSTEYEMAKELYLEKYPFAKMNFQLGDFSLYGIGLENARYVAGFGKAFSLDAEDMLRVAEA